MINGQPLQKNILAIPQGHRLHKAVDQQHGTGSQNFGSPMSQQGQSPVKSKIRRKHCLLRIFTQFSRKDPFPRRSGQWSGQMVDACRRPQRRSRMLPGIFQRRRPRLPIVFPLEITQRNFFHFLSLSYSQPMPPESSETGRLPTPKTTGQRAVRRTACPPTPRRAPSQ